VKNSSDSFALIIFGATGNLAQLKLIPALYDLAMEGLLPSKMNIIGVGRRSFSDIEFQNYTSGVLRLPNRHHNHKIEEKFEKELLSRMKYVSGDIEKKEVYDQLQLVLDKTLDCSNRIFYLATYPDLYLTIFKHISSTELDCQDCGWVRVMVEKPIGTDLASAQQLNKLLASFFREDQIYRLDHYLGRETLQNILTFRFGNSVFEHLMNNTYIDHVQVTAYEDFDIGARGGYYDTVGALRDVGQNHVLQMIAATMMEQPLKFTNEEVTKSRIQLLHQLMPLPKSIVFGQYEGYTKDLNVKKDSVTDTFFAFKTYLENKRFKNVPIFVRAGKALDRTVTEVAFIFKNEEKRLFSGYPEGERRNVLIYRIQPNEGIVLRFLSKIPGPSVKLQKEYMQFCYRNVSSNLPDPYLKLLLDALSGDQMFFIDAPEVEEQWKFIDPLFAAKKNLEIYKKGSANLTSADDLIARDGKKWLEPSVAFCAL
jgi:glucose-6-phosphate 1-dehydrogenase